MNPIRLVWFLLLALTVSLLGAPGKAQAQKDVAPDEARKIAINAYIYGYPLITNQVTRYQQSNVAKEEPLAAPLGSFKNMRAYQPVDLSPISLRRRSTSRADRGVGASDAERQSEPPPAG